MNKLKLSLFLVSLSATAASAETCPRSEQFTVENTSDGQFVIHPPVGPYTYSNTFYKSYPTLTFAGVQLVGESVNAFYQISHLTRPIECSYAVSTISGSHRGYHVNINDTLNKTISFGANWTATIDNPPGTVGVATCASATGEPADCPFF